MNFCSGTFFLSRAVLLSKHTAEEKIENEKPPALFHVLTASREKETLEQTNNLLCCVLTSKWLCSAGAASLIHFPSSIRPEWSNQEHSYIKDGELFPVELMTAQYTIYVLNKVLESNVPFFSLLHCSLTESQERSSCTVQVAALLHYVHLLFCWRFSAYGKRGHFSLFKRNNRD